MRYHPLSESEMLIVLSEEEMDYCFKKSEAGDKNLAGVMIREALDIENTVIGYQPIGTKIKVEIDKALFNRGTYAMIVHGLHIYDYKDFGEKSEIDVDIETRKIVSLKETPAGKIFGSKNESFISKNEVSPTTFEGTEAELRAQEENDYLQEQILSGICLIFDRMKDISCVAELTDETLIKTSSLYRYKEKYYLMIDINADGIVSENGIENEEEYIKLLYKMAVFNLMASEYSGNEIFDGAEDEFIFEHAAVLIKKNAIQKLKEF